MIYAGHHMAERVPQNGRYFQFLRMVLISTFSLVFSALFLFYSFSFDCAYSNLLFSIVPRITLSPSPLCIPLLPSRLSLTYYWKAIVFSRRRFSYGAAIFHDPILERREHGMRRRQGREERGQGGRQG